MPSSGFAFPLHQHLPFPLRSCLCSCGPSFFSCDPAFSPAVLPFTPRLVNTLASRKSLDWHVISIPMSEFPAIKESTPHGGALSSFFTTSSSISSSLHFFISSLVIDKTSVQCNRQIPTLSFTGAYLSAPFPGIFNTHSSPSTCAHTSSSALFCGRRSQHMCVPLVKYILRVDHVPRAPCPRY